MPVERAGMARCLPVSVAGGGSDPGGFRSPELRICRYMMSAGSSGEVLHAYV